MSHPVDTGVPEKVDRGQGSGQLAGDTLLTFESPNRPIAQSPNRPIAQSPNRPIAQPRLRENTGGWGLRAGVSPGRFEPSPAQRFTSFSHDEPSSHDQPNLDSFWLEDEALEESANLPAPEVIAADVVADLEAALEQFRLIEEELR